MILSDLFKALHFFRKVNSVKYKVCGMLFSQIFAYLDILLKSGKFQKNSPNSPTKHQISPHETQENLSKLKSPQIITTCSTHRSFALSVKSDRFPMNTSLPAPLETPDPDETTVYLYVFATHCEQKKR